jgi:hypothetical protein
MNDQRIEAIYVGTREAMIAEVAAFDPMALHGMTPARCRYLSMPFGDAQWDTEYYATKAEAIADAKALARELGVPVRYV